VQHEKKDNKSFEILSIPHSILKKTEEIPHLAISIKDITEEIHHSSQYLVVPFSIFSDKVS
jgi:hypothetical protein